MKHSPEEIRGFVSLLSMFVSMLCAFFSFHMLKSLDKSNEAFIQTLNRMGYKEKKE